MKLRILLVALGVALLAACGSSSQREVDRIPVLLYHAWDLTADDFENDLSIIHEHGFEVIPAVDLVRWVRGELKILDYSVVITFDDGMDSEYYSFLPIAEKHRAHLTSFVIASNAARIQIDPSGNMSDYWWHIADRSEFMSIENHTLDHEHDTVYRTLDKEIMVYVPSSGLDKGHNNPENINSFPKADAYVRVASDLIQNKTNRRPELFAYAFRVTDFLRNEYLSQHGEAIGLIGAFGLGNDYAMKASNVWDIPRFSRGDLPWRTPDDLRNILHGAK